MIPNCLLVAQLDLLNSFTGLIVPQVVTGYGIFMLILEPHRVPEGRRQPPGPARPRDGPGPPRQYRTGFTVIERAMSEEDPRGASRGARARRRSPS